MNSKNKIGPKTALLICLPIGLLFCLMAIIISLFPPFNFPIALSYGKLFWSPISIIIPLIFIYLLWKGGKKIEENLQQNKSVLKTSFLFSVYVNSYLFLVILILQICSKLFFPLNDNSDLTFLSIGLITTLVVYLVSTCITTFTIGLITVNIIRTKTINN